MHKMNPARMIHKYGVDIKVWSSGQFYKPRYPGAPTTDPDVSELNDDDAKKLHEPVLPMSSHLAQLFAQLDGGGEVQGDLLWLSINKYPIKSVVYAPTKGGYYKVTSRSSYEGYTNPHFFEYQLKGVNQDDTNPVADAANEEQLPGSVHAYPGS